MTTLSTKILGGALLTAASSTGIAITHRYTSPKTIREKLEANNYKILDTTEHTTSNTNADYDKWTNKISKWEEVSKFIGETKPSAEDNNKKISSLQQKCKSLLEKEIKDEDYSNAEKHCAVKKES